uniref:Beta-amyrin 16-alpha-hydroxylase CYP87D16 n=1 Tax=Maesa lanceolata TaxID=992730 RepID=C87D1_MAELA|nr:RecName: Full=Beta-amyrin 16-alpha-hydroxylase CYP87D16; AltName: Full=Cytochrome P450 87D16 [Maesa lanceolata]AHF22090.1 CYP87D16 [Maesa lanceolata]
MWVVGLIGVAVVTILITQYVYKWRNPKTVGVLPPGSMGLPLIGETLQLLSRNPSLDLHPFIKSRIQRYGQIFATNIVGRPIIVTADPQLNNYLFQQEGRAVELWYLDSFQKLFNLEGANRPNAVGHIHKYVRSVYLSLFGVESLKTKLLADIEKTVRKNLIGGTTKGTFDAKHASANMVAVFAAKYLFGHDYEKSKEDVGSIIDNFVQGLLAFPLNVPGTKFHKCMKDKKRLESMITNKLKERIADPNSGQGDFLDQAVKDLNSEFFITETFIVSVTMGALFATVESVSTAIGLAFKFFAEHPWVLDDLKAEHEAVLSKREDRNSPLTWDEYRSMTHTMHFINEVVRLGNVFPGILRKALKDIPYNGYTIPSGWTIMIVTSTLAMNPEIFKDPLAFNPKRWRDIDPETQTKNFMPFGGGTRQCAGAELAKAFFATFLHVLISEYSWKKVKGGSVARTPMLSFEDGIFIEVTKKNK